MKSDPHCQFLTHCTRHPAPVLIKLTHTCQVHKFQEALSHRNEDKDPCSFSPCCLSCVFPAPSTRESPRNYLPLCRWMLCLFKLSHMNPGQSRKCISCSFTWFTLAEWVLTCALGKRRSISERGNQVLRLGERTRSGAESRT